MLLLNYPIHSFDYILADSVACIANSNPKAMPILVENLEVLGRHCADNHTSFAVLARSPKQAIFANHFNAKYILSLDLLLARKIQQLAESYLFDAKILCVVTHKCEVETVSQYGIDGVFFIQDYASFLQK